MSTPKPQSPAMELLLAALKKNPKASYAEIKAAADERKLKLYPIMFGRAQAMLGIVKQAARGKGKAAKARAAAAAASKRGRPPAGSGASKSDQIPELLKTGMAPAEIAKKVGCSTNLVYVVKSKGGDGAAKRHPGRPRAIVVAAKRGPGRPPKAGGSNGLDGLVAMIRQSDQERARMFAALKQIQLIIAQFG